MTVDDMIDKLDIHGVLMLQGMLVNRGLKLLHEQKEEKAQESKLWTPDTPLSI